MKPPPPRTVRHVIVVGTGVIGTSVALALRQSGVTVHLADRDPDALAQAVRMGAGEALPGTAGRRAAVVIIATPPSTVVEVLADAQARGLGSVYTDVASTKSRILAQAERAGCDLTTYVPGHPLAGHELSGPSAAHADMFTARPWALCPHPSTPPRAVRRVAALVTLCGARPTILTPETHDEMVAAVSHVPHLVSAALAARFAAADEHILSLAGKGLQDTTRIARGAPALWRDILQHNAHPIATVLEAIVHDLTEAALALRTTDPEALTDLLTRGNRGRDQILNVLHPTPTP
ncbi:prephenate dehydrogenase [Sphaerisporangium aureirubrum]|uniref:Prephenate dehydrogenase n=1 Tax=Sphaerisporangium aureirubrum TaxID=1544736 RepID=A0ABW1NNZ7_9ACTN